MVPTGEHECAWKEHALDLQKQLDDVAEKQRLQQEQLEALKKKIFGKSSEKMPPMEREARRGETPDPEKSQVKRRANAALRAAKIKTEVPSLDASSNDIATQEVEPEAGVDVPPEEIPAATAG